MDMRDFPTVLIPHENHFLGLIESYLYGWYIALVFVPLYNYFNRGNVRSG